MPRLSIPRPRGHARLPSTLGGPSGLTWRVSSASDTDDSTPQPGTSMRPDRAPTVVLPRCNPHLIRGEQPSSGTDESSQGCKGRPIGCPGVDLSCLGASRSTGYPSWVGASGSNRLRRDCSSCFFDRFLFWPPSAYRSCGGVCGLDGGACGGSGLPAARSEYGGA